MRYEMRLCTACVNFWPAGHWHERNLAICTPTDVPSRRVTAGCPGWTARGYEADAGGWRAVPCCTEREEFHKTSSGSKGLGNVELVISRSLFQLARTVLGFIFLLFFRWHDIGFNNICWRPLINTAIRALGVADFEPPPPDWRVGEHYSARCQRAPAQA